MTAGWPLSAVGTELLLRRPVARGRALSLTLKELVVSGTWRLSGRSVPGRLWGTRTVAVLTPGTAPVPDRPPLRRLDARLRRLAPSGAELTTVVAGLQREAGFGLTADLLRLAQDDLEARGLLRREQRFLRTAAVRTPLGDSWCGGLAARRAAWRDALAAGGTRATAALEEMAQAPGLVALFDRKVLRDVDRVVRRDGWSDGGDVDWGSLCDLDGGLGGLDGAFDAVDGAGADSGGDGGGDGGGGGD